MEINFNDVHIHLDDNEIRINAQFNEHKKHWREKHQKQIDSQMKKENSFLMT